MYSQQSNPNAGLMAALKFQPETRFDDEAASWDLNPFTRKSSEHALGVILEHFPQLQQYKDTGSDGLSVLEIGCGTGLLSLLVAPYIQSLTAVDVSTGMIAALKGKLSAPHNNIHNVQPVCVMLEDPNDPTIQDAGASSVSPKRFDLVISHLVLHHIPSLSAILDTMFGTLKPGGSVCLTDFENFGPEARKFHPEAKMAGVERHGIQRTEMEALLKEAGFVEVRVETGFTMDKDIEPSGSLPFPFLVCLGKKPS